MKNRFESIHEKMTVNKKENKLLEKNCRKT